MKIDYLYLQIPLEYEYSSLVLEESDRGET